MSGKSAQHVSLVERLIAAVESRHADIKGVVIFADHHRFGVNQPPTIGGYKPDVFAQDLWATFRVIGEAKTDNDLKSERSSRQICAFLDHLALYPNSSLYIAVPWILKARVNYMLRELRKPYHQSVHVSVFSFT